MVEISQTFLAFSKYMNFNIYHENTFLNYYFTLFGNDFDWLDLHQVWESNNEKL